jgi:hypothetical protein
VKVVAFEISWRLPVNAVLIRSAGTAVIVSHFHGVGRFSRNGQGLGGRASQKEGEAAVE